MTSLLLWLRLAWRDLSMSKKEVLTSLITLAFGFLTLMSILLFRESSQSYISRKAVTTMAADLALSSTAAFEPEVVKEFEQQLDVETSSDEIEFLAMVRTAEHSRLSEIKAVSFNYPLAGSITLESLSDPLTDKLLSKHQALIGKDLAEQMNLGVGDFVSIGDQQFQVSGILIQAPGISRSSFGAAPRVLIHYDRAQDTGLIRFGSQVRYRRYYLLSDQQINESSLDALEKWADQKELSLTTPLDSVRGLDRALEFFGRYLSLVSLMMTLLFFMTGFYLLQLYVARRVSHIAIFQTYGASPRSTQVFFLALTGWITLFAFLVAYIGLWLGSRLSQPLINHLSPDDVPFLLQINQELFLWAALAALISCILAYLPMLVRMRMIAPRLLFEQSSPDLPQTPKDKQVWIAGSVMGGFYLLATWLLDSPKLALAFLSFIIVSLVAGAWLSPKLFSKISRTGLIQAATTRLALLNLSRVRFTQLLLFLCLSQVSFSAILIVHFFSFAQAELEAPTKEQMPALFLINIEEDTLPDLKAFFEKSSARLRYVSPLVLARFTTQNDKPPKSERFEKFPVRLSYRDGLIESESLVKGKEVSASYDPDKQSMASITIEQRFAKRSQIQIGDVLEFEVQGIPVQGQVTGLRKVKWSSFQPNFFIQFQPGVLNEFPKSFIGVVYQEKGPSISRLQLNLSRSFPSLTIIDVSEAIQKVVEMVGQLMIPVRAVAILALLACVVLIFGLTGHSVHHRHSEMRLLHWLGITRIQIQGLLTKEYLFYSLLANAFGFTLAWAGTSAVSRWALPSEIEFLWWESSLIMLGLSLLTSILTLVFYRPHQAKMDI